MIRATFGYPQVQFVVREGESLDAALDKVVNCVSRPKSLHAPHFAACYHFIVLMVVESTLEHHTSSTRDLHFAVQQTAPGYSRGCEHAQKNGLSFFFCLHSPLTV